MFRIKASYTGQLELKTTLERAREFFGDDQTRVSVHFLQQAMRDLLELREFVWRVMSLSDEEVDQYAEQNGADVDIGGLPQRDEPFERSTEIATRALEWADDDTRMYLTSNIAAYAFASDDFERAAPVVDEALALMRACIHPDAGFGNSVADHQMLATDDYADVAPAHNPPYTKAMRTVGFIAGPASARAGTMASRNGSATGVPTPRRKVRLAGDWRVIIIVRWPYILRDNYCAAP